MQAPAVQMSPVYSHSENHIPIYRVEILLRRPISAWHTKLARHLHSCWEIKFPDRNKYRAGSETAVLNLNVLPFARSEHSCCQPKHSG